MMALHGAAGGVFVVGTDGSNPTSRAVEAATELAHVSARRCMHVVGGHRPPPLGSSVLLVPVLAAHRHVKCLANQPGGS
jgi:hypothetical protein